MILTQRGVNFIEAEAFDSVGNSFRTVQSFIIAPTFSESPPGALATVRLGQPSLQLIEQMVGQFLNGDTAHGVTADDLAARLPHPSSTSSHLGISVVVDVTDISLGQTTISLQPQSGTGAVLRLDASVTSQTRATGWSRFLGGNHDFSCTVASAQLSATYQIQVNTNGQAVVVPLSAAVQLGETEFDLAGAPDFIAGDVSEHITSAIEDALRTSLPDLLGGALEGVAGTRELGSVHDMLATVEPLTWSYGLAGISSDSNGVNVLVRIGADAGQGWESPDFPGAPVYASGAQPTPPQLCGLGLAVSADTVNRMLHALWRGGALSKSFDARPYLPQLDTLPLDPWNVTVAVNAQLPPQVTMDSNGKLFVTLGDLQVDLFVASQMGAINATAYVGAEVEVEVRADGAGYHLVPTIRRLLLDIDHISPEGIYHDAIEAYLEPLARKYLTDFLSETPLLPIPEINLGRVDLPGTIRLSNLQITVGSTTASICSTPQRAYP